MPQIIENRSIGELFRDFSHETLNLVRQEVEFAKTEITQKASRTGKDVAFMAVGGVIAFGGFLCILTTIIAALAIVLPLWAAALLTGGVVSAIGLILLAIGIGRLEEGDLKPVQTQQRLKEDSQWLKNQMM